MTDLDLTAAPHSRRAPDLFDAIEAPSDRSSSKPAPAKAKNTRRGPSKQARNAAQSHTVLESDLPSYDAREIEAAEQAIAALPTQRLWFTYRDIAASFGVSRATVIRRLRDRLVPGVVIAGDRLEEEGSVRRLDRRQLRWLLLAVRSTRSR